MVENIMDSDTSSSVAVNLLFNSKETGCFVRIDNPKSPRDKLFTYEKNWLANGLSRPNSFFAISICFAEGWLPTQRETGSPGITLVMKNDMVITLINTINEEMNLFNK